MRHQNQWHLPHLFVQGLGNRSSLFQNHVVLLHDSHQDAGTRRARLGTICPSWSAASERAPRDRRERKEKGEGRVWGIDLGRRGSRRLRTADEESPQSQRKMLYHSNRGKCLKKGSGRLCQYRGTVSQNVCVSGNTHLRTTWGVIKNSDP